MGRMDELVGMIRLRAQVWLVQDDEVGHLVRGLGHCAVALPAGDAVTRDDIGLLWRLDGLVLRPEWTHTHRLSLLEKAAKLICREVCVLPELPRGVGEAREYEEW